MTLSLHLSSLVLLERVIYLLRPPHAMIDRAPTALKPHHYRLKGEKAPCMQLSMQKLQGRIVLGQPGLRNDPSQWLAQVMKHCEYSGLVYMPICMAWKMAIFFESSRRITGLQWGEEQFPKERGQGSVLMRSLGKHIG